jgi:hypothetical protein
MYNLSFAFGGEGMHGMIAKSSITSRTGQSAGLRKKFIFNVSPSSPSSFPILRSVSLSPWRSFISMTTDTCPFSYACF